MSTRRFFLRHKVLVAVVCVLIPVSVFFGWIVRSAISQVETQIADANQSSLQVYHNLFMNEILRIEEYLNETAYREAALTSFAAATDKQSVETASGEIIAQFEAQFSQNQDVTAFILSNANLDVLEVRFNTVVSYDRVKQEIETFSKDLLCGSDIPIGWFLVPSQDRAFLCRVMSAGDASVMAVIDLHQATRNAVLLYGQKGSLVFYQQNAVLGNEAFLKSSDIALSFFSKEPYYFAGKHNSHMVVQMPLLNFRVALVLPFEKDNGAIGLLYLSPYLYLFLAVATLLLVSFYLRKALFLPLSNMVSTMRKIQAGDLSARLSAQKSAEFVTVQATFNNMVTELSSLRIRSYEQQLETERAQLAALRMQIRPHFYLNCIKSIFGLLEIGKTAQIQKALLYLSSHMRYVLDIQTDIITLEKELQMCDNYVRLHQECECGHPTLRIAIDTAAMQVKVPPVSCLSSIDKTIGVSSIAVTSNLCVTPFSIYSGE